ncbi:hypothetical protein C8Z91_08315 [Paenibacillus elgii]|uniref:YmcC n=1 Tax=Paenibacillus elgii TaxID=189691 RepID=A0A2T6G5I9_9BACL|nr:hypothetical protein [Paenibacillus elgii]PUA39421.1 hypothetical protein C8Z91_08315 [Paenibacillus elgii]
MTIAAFIIGCEIGFWVFVVAGLVFRYILGMKRIGALLLVVTPVVDLVLITATVIDLRNGATASFVHGLAAIYIGVSVAFGHQMIRWADVRFAHRFAGAPAPEPKPKHGTAHARRERQTWFLHLLAWIIGCLILLGMIWFVDDESRTADLGSMIWGWAAILGIDFIWSFSYTFWPKKA